MSLAQVEQSAARVGGLDYDHVAGDRDRGDAVVGLAHRQRHDRALGTADHLDDVAQAHVDHVDRVLAILLHRQDQVAGIELALAPGRAAGDHLADLDVVVALGEHRADAFEGAAHLDLEVRLLLRRQVVRVRTEDAAQGVDEGLDGFEWARRGQALETTLVVGGQILARLLVALGIGLGQDVLAPLRVLLVLLGLVLLGLVLLGLALLLGLGFFLGGASHAGDALEHLALEVTAPEVA